SDTLYLTGYSTNDITIVITRDGNYIFTDKRYVGELNSLFAGEYTIIDGNLSDIYNLVCDSEVVGIDEDITFKEMKAIIDTFSQYRLDSEKGKRLQYIHDIIKTMRCVKSDREIECIQRAQSITDATFSKIIPYIKEGVSEIYIAATIDYIMRCEGATTAFDTIVAFGENTAYPHAHPTDRRLKRGDFITMDFGAKINGYCSDMTRTVAYGYASDEMKRAYDCVLQANLIGISSLKAGISGKDVDSAARNYLDSCGYGKYFIHSLGHSVGIDIHEEPVLSQKNDSALCSGVVITVEPGVYMEEKFGIRIEDMLKITEDGADNLTKSSKSLIIIDDN
ncbi:MAG: aminopeptidase P family protein, partial [Clostridia bacterium]|nr:aminopeptidase P family protein [Clostridia bacterium]